ncbi:hypothetical protein EBZ39_19685, partial [bacterium]|nr:hypothetical protein [bacterium]
VMDVKLYTGNGSTQTISGLGFSPDLVWIKSRSNSFYHRLYDTIRGTTKALYSNTTETEGLYQSDYENFTAFNSDGFSLGSTSLENGINKNNSTFVSWCWDAGSTTVTNTQGSITGGAQVRANATAGFSVVTYTTTGSASTVGHGLNVAPSFIITKQRNGTTAWYCYHTSIGAGNYVLLNSTAASAGGSTWNNTAPTSSVFSVGSGFGNGETYVAYCFAPVVGYSSLYTGFRPRWLMLKRGDGSSNWYIVDAARSPFNVIDDLLFAENSIQEGVDDGNNAVDFLSNGFKLRKGLSNSNLNNSIMLYAAFAESPFQFSRAR